MRRGASGNNRPGSWPNHIAVSGSLDCMKVRRALANDWPLIRQIHKAGRYGFELPGFMFGTHIAEEDGRIIAAAGYVPVAQVIGVVEYEAPPLTKMQAIKALHRPMGEIVVDAGYTSVFAFCDPSYRGFQ